MCMLLMVFAQLMMSRYAPALVAAAKEKGLGEKNSKQSLRAHEAFARVHEQQQQQQQQQRQQQQQQH